MDAWLRFAPRLRPVLWFGTCGGDREQRLEDGLSGKGAEKKQELMEQEAIFAHPISG